MLNFFHILPVMIMAPLLAISHSHKHLLMCLLNLESMILSIIIASFILMLKFSPMDSLNMLILLAMGACEASLGLACMVKMIRSWGNDNLKMLNTKYL